MKNVHPARGAGPLAMLLLWIGCGEGAVAPQPAERLDEAGTRLAQVQHSVPDLTGTWSGLLGGRSDVQAQQEEEEEEDPGGMIIDLQRGPRSSCSPRIQRRGRPTGAARAGARDHYPRHR